MQMVRAQGVIFSQTPIDGYLNFVRNSSVQQCNSWVSARQELIVYRNTTEE